MQQLETKISYPEIQQVPPVWLGLPVVRGGRQVEWWTLMPEAIREEVVRALPIFGLSLTVFVPMRDPLGVNPLIELKGDPIIVGVKDGKLYLVAAWEIR